MADVITPADILNGHADNVEYGLSGVDPEPYRTAALLISQHEQRHGVKFYPVPEDVFARLRDAHTTWADTEARELGTHSDGREMAEIVAELLALVNA